MNDWTLLIDFGTSITKAAIADADGRIEPVEVRGGFVTPSGIWADPGGKLATEAAAQVLRQVAAEAGRRRRGKPQEIRLTCSARWNQARRDELLTAARLAGLGSRSISGPPTLVDHPVAAGLELARLGRFGVGSTIAMLGLGGGSAETAVLEFRADGIVIRALGGIEGVGGDQFDELLYRHMVGQAMTGWDTAHARRLWQPTEEPWRRAAADLFAEVRRAKEELSRQHVVQLHTGPPIDSQLELSRIELEAVLRPLILRTARELAATIELAGMRPRQLDGILITGGSSQIPLVARVIFDVIGIHPQPLTGVEPYLGAASWTPQTRLRPESTPITVAGGQTGEEAAAAAAAAAAALAATGAIDLLAIGTPAKPTLPSLPRSETASSASSFAKTGRSFSPLRWLRRRWPLALGVAVVTGLVGLALNGPASGDDDSERGDRSSASLGVDSDAKPVAVTGLSVTTRNISIDLSWDEMPGATAYSVVRDPGTPQESERTVERTSFTDRPGDAGEHRYAVAAVDATETVGARSAEVAARAVAPFGKVQNIASAWTAVVPVAPGRKGSAGQTCRGSATRVQLSNGRIRCTFGNGVRVVIYSFASPEDRDRRGDQLADRKRVKDGRWSAAKRDGGRVTGRLLTSDAKAGGGPWRWWSYDKADTFAIQASWPEHSAAQLNSWWRQRAPFTT